MNLEPHIIVVLYSKFSSACKNFVSIVGTMDIMKSIQFICVDNRDIRKTITEEGNLKVSSLPCLLKIFDSGDIQLFEGQTAFDVLESYKNLGAKPVESASVHKASPEQQQSQIQQQLLQSQLKIQPKSEISSLKDDKMAVNTFHYIEPNQQSSDAQTRPIPESLVRTPPETAAAKAQRLQKERESSQMFPPLPGSPEHQAMLNVQGQGVPSGGNYTTVL